MAIITSVGALFIEELPLSIHKLSEGAPSDVIRVALYGPNAVLSASTETYTTSGEVVGGGYSAGGVVLSGLVVVGKSGSARAGGLQFSHAYIQPTEDTVITVSGVAVRGCLMYNVTQGNRTICILDFGEIKMPIASISLEWGVAGVTAFNQVLIPLIGGNI